MRVRASRWAWVSCVACIGACSGGGGGGQTSGGVPDGVDVNAGPDGGSTDVGAPGAGAADAGAPDAGPPDGGSAGGDTLGPPLSKDGWTFYDSSQGLPGDVSDVSADEGGNVYVAGGDAAYVKKRADQRFLRFDARNAGLTENCYPVADPNDATQLDRKLHPDPPGPGLMCPVISVAGGAPGIAMIGFRGIGTDGDDDADWAQDSGGADLITFDGANLTRTRHVFIASPPHTICPSNGDEAHTYTCSYAYDWFWVMGRRKLRQVERIVVNHRKGSAMYGDFFMGGAHASISALLNNAAARGYPDRITGQPARWLDAAGVWEHDHPAFYSASRDAFLTGESHALAIDPRSGTPWCSNGFRTAYLTGGYGPDLHGGDDWWLHPQTPPNALYYDFWPDNTVPTESLHDDVESLSFCFDGALWIGSGIHGLARMDPGGGVSYVGLPDPGLHGDSVLAVACDPSDSSLWIGLGWGGAMRLKGGAFTQLDPLDTSLPAFTHQPVRSIQIDAWSSPRIVYFAFEPSKDADGNVTRPGGVAAYQGP